jgi:hypothetical protein
VARAFDPKITTESAFGRAREWAEYGKRIAYETHRQAPRRGFNLNRYGERRSAAKDPPAMETGQLFAILNQQKPERERDGYSFVVNYTVLEKGYQKGNRILEPRPLGRITLSTMIAAPGPA